MTTSLTMPVPCEHKRALWNAVKVTSEEARRGVKPTLVSPYFDQAGEVVFARVRLDTDNGKWIRPFHLDGDRWRLGEPAVADGKKPLLNLPLLAMYPDDEVWLVEGEKCAAALTDVGVLAMTSGSATSVRGADW
ncbi:hypothetical protein EGI20_07625, partial [Aquitalea sp. S1-19]|nr:hypothetical protein [Aquitalea sp. S1-19]